MKRWQFWLGMAVSAVCIVLVLTQVDDWGKFGDSFLQANYIYIPLIIASYFVIMVLRSVRWRYILNHCGHAGFRNTLVAILVCYMGNNIFPLRAGELMRVFLIGKKEESISYSAALATVVVERMFDFLSMLLFLALVLIFIPFPEQRLIIHLADRQVDLEAAIRAFGAGTLIGALGLFFFLIALNLWTDKALGLAETVLRIAPAKLAEKILDALRRFSSGLTIMGRPKALVAVTGMSVFIWFVNLSTVWLSGLAFNIHIGFMGVMFILVVGSAAASIPATPGFFGTFHLFNQQGLLFLMPGIDPGTALSFAIVLHACYYFPLVAAGAIALWIEGVSLTKLREESREEAEEKKADASECGQ